MHRIRGPQCLKDALRPWSHGSHSRIRAGFEGQLPHHRELPPQEQEMAQERDERDKGGDQRARRLRGERQRVLEAPRILRAKAARTDCLWPGARFLVVLPGRVEVGAELPGARRGGVVQDALKGAAPEFCLTGGEQGVGFHAFAAVVFRASHLVRTRARIRSGSHLDRCARRGALRLRLLAVAHGAAAGVGCSGVSQSVQALVVV